MIDSAILVQEFIEDAILSGNLCAAQAVLLSDRSAERVRTCVTLY